MENCVTNIERKKLILELGITKDYDMFSFVEGNRPISNASVTRLAASMRKHGFFPSQHITVYKKGNKLLITDGQNRKKAAEKEGIAIPYVIDNKLTPDMCVLINSLHNRWASKDYLHYYVTKGLRDYEILDDFQKEYGFSVTNSMCLLQGVNGGSKIMVKFRDGKFKVNDLLLAREIVLNIQDFKRYFSEYRKRHFIEAIMSLTKTAGYSQSKMMRKMETRHEQLLIRGSRLSYIDNLLNIYNFRVGKENQLKFANE
ncbi:MAG: hypothetical protein GY928_27805 [Colwellia sp.]|nr:hypothetical protein [Colwellia sp.]